MEYMTLSHLYYKDKAGYENLYKQRISSESTCILPIKIHDHDAFYCLCPEIYLLSSEIMRLDKEIAVLCKDLPGAALEQFAVKCLLDETHLTNAIEGVHSTIKELAAVYDELDKPDNNKKFYGLVKKYSMMTTEKFSLQSCSDIRKIYDELVLPEVIEACPGNAPDGTIFRKDRAEVTTETQKVIHKGVYPERKVIEKMEKALLILNDNSMPILIRISLFHYFFGYIHPFYDGNGRTSRFISSYLLSSEFEYLIGYRLSYTIRENLKQYYNAFQVCNDTKNKGDLTPFIIMFLTIINESFKNLYEALCKRMDALNKYRDIIQNISEISEDSDKEFCYILVQAGLFSNRGIPKKGLCEVLEISPSTVDKRLAKIRNLGLLKELRGERAIMYKLDLDKLSE